VSAITLLPGQSVTADQITEALGGLAHGAGPDVVRVAPEIPATTWYRPYPGALPGEGVGGSGTQAWYRTMQDDYAPVTAAVRRKLGGVSSR
jgi:putative long chain acyl-CoA synthase